MHLIIIIFLSPSFKWMGNESYHLRSQNKTVLFSFEEAIGFCVGNIVKDKDGDLSCIDRHYFDILGKNIFYGPYTKTYYMRILLR
jgi:hypothetical protein